MRFRLITALLTVSVAGLALATSAGAALIGIYRNAMESTGQRAQVVKLAGERCGRGGSDHAFRMTVGKQTKECTYRTPVLGRDLEIAATARLLSNTPESLQKKAYLALNLRSGDGGHYQLAVYPMQGKSQLRKVLPDGSIQYLQIEKNVKTVQGLNKANDLRLRAFNVTGGPEKGSCRILAYVGGTLVGDVVDPAAGELQGRASGFSVGASTIAKGAVASVDNLVIRVPSPF